MTTMTILRNRPRTARRRKAFLVRAIGLLALLPVAAWSGEGSGPKPKPESNPTPASAYEAPRRLVSICLPGDQLLLTLVPRGEIVALSWLVSDPDLSPHWEEARGIPTTRGSAEELVKLKPDLVLAGKYSTPATTAMLKRLKVPVIEIGVPNNFEELQEQIRETARSLGPEAEERARTILEKMEARLKRLADSRQPGDSQQSQPGPSQPTALLYFQDGYTPGGHTFADAILEAAGFRNLALAWRETASTPLERVILAKPDFLILVSYREASPTFTEISGRHPLLRKLKGIKLVSIPFRDLACPDPSNLDLVEALHARMLSGQGRNP